ncbi:hypothetical protein BCU95_07830 [Vibrio splendidus]|nr:hypothetical protein BCU95_07830 [Vibrio splendidus]
MPRVKIQIVTFLYKTLSLFSKLANYSLLNQKQSRNRTFSLIDTIKILPPIYNIDEKEEYTNPN